MGKVSKKTKVPVVKLESNEDYMKGQPTRAEVAQYVSSAMENFYIPLLSEQVQLSAMIIQAILIEKNVCTGEEIKRITKEFTQEHIFRQNVIKNRDAIQEFLAKESEISGDSDLQFRVRAIEKCLKEKDYNFSDKNRIMIQQFCAEVLKALESKEDLKSLSVKALTLRNALIDEGVLFNVADKSEDVPALFGSAILHVLTEIVMVATTSIVPKE